ncbi:MAG: hypothetical protein RIC29_17535, partial [Rhodospirillaceae bacterium]
NVMRVPEALDLCPELVLVTQRPDLFRRAHNALLNEIACAIPIETVKSIDEMTCLMRKKSPTSLPYAITLISSIGADGGQLVNQRARAL